MQSYRQLIERTRLLEKDRNISLDFTDKKIVDSWIRCFENGLSPERNSIESVISASKLNELQDEYNDIRGFILPELELLHSQIAGTNFRLLLRITRELFSTHSMIMNFITVKQERFLYPAQFGKKNIEERMD